MGPYKQLSRANPGLRTFQGLPRKWGLSHRTGGSVGVGARRGSGQSREEKAPGPGPGEKQGLAGISVPIRGQVGE